MTQQRCFVKDGVLSPICGVHDVQLVETEITSLENPPGLGHIRSFVCPISREPLIDAEGL
jgi:hypothetical protein